MGLLDNAEVRGSRLVYREYKPGKQGSRNPEDWVEVQPGEPCVEITMPDKDWREIERIIQAHEQALLIPAVQDAWDQYVMITHLTKTYEEVKNR